MTLQSRWETAIAEWQAAGLHPDEKALADALPARDAEATLAAWTAGPPDFTAFVREHLRFPEADVPAFQADASRSPHDHIRALWPTLTRPADPKGWQGTRLPLSKPSVVPGGRFQELYYWDSYFTMLGLALHGEKKAVLHMLDNFAGLIEVYGHIPNGTRTYFLSRSQPPYFSLMVRLAVDRGWTTWKAYAMALRAEHTFWMQGATDLTADGQAHRRVVQCGGYTLNRYWDDADGPRLEMSEADRQLATQSNRPPSDLYRNIRAACESGWDFSSRWMADATRLDSLETTSIVPVDLNSLMLHLEWALAQAFPAERLGWMARHRERKTALQTLFWDGSTFVDVDLNGQTRSQHRSAAMLYPLWVGVADEKQSRSTLEWVTTHLEGPGGISTTAVASGQQWDAPNAWAPLQWTAIAAAARNGIPEHASAFAKAWCHACESVYSSKTAFVEKYDAFHPADPAKGGEYALQDGFGWSNGVYLASKHYLETGELVGY
jgi:alpha,alpha-trehalase